MSIDDASKGIGIGLGMIGVGIGLKFMQDVTHDLRKSTKKKKVYKPTFKPISWKL